MNWEPRTRVAWQGLRRAWLARAYLWGRFRRFASRPLGAVFGFSGCRTVSPRGGIRVGVKEASAQREQPSPALSWYPPSAPLGPASTHPPQELRQPSVVACIPAGLQGHGASRSPPAPDLRRKEDSWMSKFQETLGTAFLFR